MVAQPNRLPMRVEDYLTLDDASPDYRYEYVDGDVCLLARGSSDHSIIASNLIRALRRKPCIVYTSDVHLQLSESHYVHPDVTVDCDPRDNKKRDTIQYPCMLVEVLSPSTEATDRGEKFDAYLALPSLQVYVMIDSQKKKNEAYHREGETWIGSVYISECLIDLKIHDLHIDFDEIYEKTSLS